MHTSYESKLNLPEPSVLPHLSDLPDPLTFFEGSRVASPADWMLRRQPELRRLFQHYMYGLLPDAPGTVRSSLLYENRRAFGGKATLRELAVDVGPPAHGPIHLLLATPNKLADPAPIFVGIAFSGNHAALDDPGLRQSVDPWHSTNDGRPKPPGRGEHAELWNIEQSIDRGYAVALFRSADVAPDRPDWPTEAGPGPYGSIGLWAWGASRIVDYLQTDPDIDPRRIAVVGHSRNGKAAIVAAAFDERIAMAIPSQAGCGGTAPSRTEVGEKLENINGTFPHWFNERFKAFNNRPERLPFDQHCLIALVAPRPILLSNAEEDSWANPTGQFEMLKAADPVYRLLEAGGLESDKMPVAGTLSFGRLGYFIRPGRHSMAEEDWKAFLDYADRWL